MILFIGWGVCVFGGVFSVCDPVMFCCVGIGLFLFKGIQCLKKVVPKY